MATVKKGVLTNSPEWWVHLRPYNKRYFWKRERKAARRDTLQRVKDDLTAPRNKDTLSDFKADLPV